MLRPMFKDTLKSLFGRPAASGSARRIEAPVGASRAARPLPEPYSRQSLGLEQFFANLESRESQRILDLSGASQANINFVLQYGHHLYCEDFSGAMENTFGTDEDFYTRQADDQLSDQFLAEMFSNLQGPFDGALIWDNLQFLQAPILEQTITHLHRVMEPGALLFAFFPSDEKIKWLTMNSYRIEAAKTMKVLPKRNMRSVQTFNSRSLERLFGDFASVKFFLTRDHFREVIVRR